MLNGVRASPRTPKKVETDEVKTIQATFMALFPVNWKQSLKRLNKAILSDTMIQTRKRSHEVSENEYFVFIGILLLAGIQSSGGLNGLYNKKGNGGYSR